MNPMLILCQIWVTCFKFFPLFFLNVFLISFNNVKVPIHELLCKLSANFVVFTYREEEENVKINHIDKFDFKDSVMVA